MPAHAARASMHDMTPQERSVERRIRLWIVQQERNRRRAAEAGQHAARPGFTAQQRPRAAAPRRPQI